MESKTLADLLEWDPTIRVIGISRADGNATRIWELFKKENSRLLDVRLTYDAHWQAWYSTSVPTPYRMICVYRSVEELEHNAARAAKAVEA